MQALSNLLLVIYRLAQTSPPEEFQSRALDAVREVIDFDSAVWGSGVVVPEGPYAHELYSHRQPPEMLANWDRIKHLDTLNREAFQNLGQTVNADISDPYWQQHIHPEILAHVTRYGMTHTLATINADMALGFFTGISLYRAIPDRPFSKTEAEIKQNLMPHLVEAWNTNRFNFISRQSNSKQSAVARAIIDKEGILHNATQHFEQRVQSEWPTWNGPLLPVEMLDAFFSKRQQQFKGKDIVVTLTTINDLFLISIRKTSAVDNLSQREMSVANLFGRGIDYNGIAEELHISPATVRNHLKSIYSKLGVNNKTDLTRMLLEAENE
jgi:DNA-binding CsgD family transcriptional regulator